MPTATADASVSASSRWRSRLAAAGCSVESASSFVAYRAAFGALIAFGSVRFLARGWVDQFYVGPEHHLPYPRFGWVSPLPSVLMHLLIIGLAACGVLIALGVHYRLVAGVFAIGFAYTELIDASLYLNHYWFVTLAAVVLAVVPGPDADGVPRVSLWALRAQIGVVYVFAGLAKLNSDWLLDAQPMQIWLAARTDRPIVGALLDEPVVAYLASWTGALFDLTIVGWLAWRRTRISAYVAVIGFHVATAALFQIGVFPWVMIALTPIFFPPDWPDRLRRRSMPPRPRDTTGAHRPIGRSTRVALWVLLVINVALPLRHWVADGNVRFNDDGYYLAWRVMLTERTGFVEYTATDPSTGEVWRYRPDHVLDDWQAAQVARRPDLVLATAHLIASELDRRGHPGVGVTAESWVSFNGHARQRWIDPTVDLARVARTAPASAYVLNEQPAAKP